MRWFIFLSFSIWAIILFFIFRKPKEAVEYEVKTDTVRISDTIVIFDTVRITEFQPVKEYITRHDTIFLDTLKAFIPISVKEYSTEQYKAIIEGYKPNLLELEIYQKQTTIFDTIRINTSTTITRYKQPRFAVSIGGGAGSDGKKFVPFVGVTFGYVLWSR